MENKMNLAQLNSKIYRNTQTYLDRVLKKYDISSGTFRYLFILEKTDGINQADISREMGTDKAVCTRAINKLEESDYVYREINDQDKRMFNVHLTEKAKKIIPEIHREISKFEDMITHSLTQEENKELLRVLHSIYRTTDELVNGGK